MDFFDADTDNTIYYAAAIIFLIILYIIYKKEKSDRRKMQLEIEKMLELDITPRRKGDEKLMAEFEMRRKMK